MAQTIMNAGLDVCGDALSAACTHAALLDETGTELTGGTYARKAVTFTSTNGVCSLSSSVTFDVPGSKTVAYVAYYSALTSGTQYCKAAVTNQTYGVSGGQYTLTAGTITISSS